MDTKKIKILLAEDDQFISRAYTDGLQRTGYTIVNAHDGKEAVEKMKQERPDLALLDLIMPEMNGFEVLEEIKKDNNLKNIPIIVLSNLGQDTDIQKARELGADDYLIKANFTLAEVVEKLQKFIKLDS